MIPRLVISVTLILIAVAFAACSDEPSLLIQNGEFPCTVTIDGEEEETLEAKEVQNFTVGPGEHLIRAESTDGYYELDRRVKVEGKDQKVVKLVLHPSEKLTTTAYQGTFEVRLKEVNDGNCEAAAFNYRKIPSGRSVKVLDPKIKRCGASSFGYLKVSYDGEACYIDLSDLEFQKK